MFYAVARGRKVGIYRNWEEAKKQVVGFSGAVYKKFDTRKEAEAFIRGVEENTFCGIEIYTDGSSLDGEGGFAVVFEDVCYYGHVWIHPCTNQTAELWAIWIALLLTKDEDIIIYTDSEYAMNSLTAWKQDEPIITECIAAMENRKVRFIHVRAHVGIERNEIADQFAKKGRRGCTPLTVENLIRV